MLVGRGRGERVERWERWDNVRGSSVPECFGHNSGQWRDVPDDELGGRFVRRPPLSGNEESSPRPCPLPLDDKETASWNASMARFRVCTEVLWVSR
jgi:hypothetical protein